MKRLKQVVETYNSRDKLVFTSEVVADFVNDLSDQLIQILKDLQEDKTSFEKLGITYEEKAFFDILVKVRDDHGFHYEDEKCLVLAKKSKNWSMIRHNLPIGLLVMILKISLIWT